MTPVLAAAHMPAGVPPDWPGWLVIIAAGLIVLRVVLRLLGLGK